MTTPDRRGEINRLFREHIATLVLETALPGAASPQMPTRDTDGVIGAGQREQPDEFALRHLVYPLAASRTRPARATLTEETMSDDAAKLAAIRDRDASDYHYESRGPRWTPAQQDRHDLLALLDQRPDDMADVDGWLLAALADAQQTIRQRLEGAPSPDAKTTWASALQLVTEARHIMRARLSSAPLHPAEAPITVRDRAVVAKVTTFLDSYERAHPDAYVSQSPAIRDRDVAYLLAPELRALLRLAAYALTTAPVVHGEPASSDVTLQAPEDVEQMLDAASSGSDVADAGRVRRLLAEHERAIRRDEQRTWLTILADPPPGWHTFGTHIDQDVQLEFWGTDDGGLPIWERPVAR